MKIVRDHRKILDESEEPLEFQQERRGTRIGLQAEQLTSPAQIVTQPDHLELSIGVQRVVHRVHSFTGGWNECDSVRSKTKLTINQYIKYLL